MSWLPVAKCVIVLTFLTQIMEEEFELNVTNLS